MISKKYLTPKTHPVILFYNKGDQLPSQKKYPSHYGSRSKVNYYPVFPLKLTKEKEKTILVMGAVMRNKYIIWSVLSMTRLVVWAPHPYTHEVRRDHVGENCMGQWSRLQVYIHWFS